ncbi:MAG TPA: hypothetical protein VD861_14015 [Pyrinomonadaceae bacterium]|nr:hypothetical protein [Pyrinomonadaceae bacterium]
MKTRIINYLLTASLLSALYVMACAAVRAQDPLPPPPPAKDYFPDKWDEFSSAGGKFRVRFPKEPREATSKQGDMEVHSLEHKGLLHYRVSYVDYGVAIEEDPQKVKTILQALRDAALGPLKDKAPRVVAEREASVDGHPGTFVHVELQGKEVIRMQWVIAGSRLYAISATGRKGSPNEMEGKDDFEKVAMGFINSFHITP